MKIIQLTDTHLAPQDVQIWGLDPRKHLDEAIAHVNRNHGDADLCVITGDLTHNGEEEAYANLREGLAALAMPWHLIPGNHDDRETLRKVFPEQFPEESRFLQKVVETAEGNLVLMDTNDPGQASGRYCQERLNWLQERLSAIGERDAYLFMHHPPFEVGIQPMDRMNLQDGQALAEVLDQQTNVAHLFFGHLHRPISGVWNAIPYAFSRSTAAQLLLDFGPAEKPSLGSEKPGYAIIMINRGLVVVHQVEINGDSPKPKP